MKTLLSLVLILGLTLAACGDPQAPIVDPDPVVVDPVYPPDPVEPEPVEPVEPEPEPEPEPIEPEPGAEHAPLGTCPILVTGEPTTHYDAFVITLQLGEPCNDGDTVPFTYRRNYLDGTFNTLAEGTLIKDGRYFWENIVRFAIPREKRTNRMEILDARSGQVIASVQNYRFREPR